MARKHNNYSSSSSSSSSEKSESSCNNNIQIVYKFPKNNRDGEMIVNEVIDRLNASLKNLLPNIIIDNNHNTTTTTSNNNKEKKKKKKSEEGGEPLTKESKYMVTINILQCKEGSRWGRICCGELGIGWIVLEISWILTTTTTATTTTSSSAVVLAEGKQKLRDSGGIGVMDLGQSDYAQFILLDDMTPKLATDISNSVLGGVAKHSSHNYRQCACFAPAPYQ